MSVAARPQSFRENLRHIWDRRLAAIFFLGFCSGFPWVIIGSAMTLWLQESELSRTAIGYFGSIFVLYALNFLWSPLLDRVRLPGLYAWLGQRRSWIFLCLLLIGVTCVLVSETDPQKSIVWVSALALLIALASATQDVAIDAYRIERFSEQETEKLSYAAAAATSGWWAGYGFIGGAVVLFLGGETIGFTWAVVYKLIAGLVGLQILGLLLLDEPESQRFATQNAQNARYRQDIGMNRAISWLAVTVFEPIAEFFRRCGWRLSLSLLLFVLLFKLGEAFLGRMSIVFYKEIGFTTDQIGFYSKVVSGGLTVVFSIVGAFINTRFGVIKGLMLGGIAMAASNLIFAWIAAVGPDTRLYGLGVVVDGFTTAFATVSFVAFISYFTSRTYTATQYALLASIGNLGRTTLSAGSGKLVDSLGGDWVLFFVLTTLMVIPGLVLLYWIGRMLAQEDAAGGITRPAKAD